MSESNIKSRDKVTFDVRISSLRAISTIFTREFLGYFRTPVAYVFIVVFLVAVTSLSWYMGGLFRRDDANLQSFFVFFPWIYLFLIPAVGMRLWAEEKRSGTWELLFTYPVSVGATVIAKFLAAWAFVTIAIASTALLPITIEYLGDPDWGPIYVGYLGSILMAGSYLSICSLASSLTKNQVISFVISIVICLVLVLLGFSMLNQLLTKIFPVAVVDALAGFSFITHYDSMMKGLLTLKDVTFFSSIIVFCLWLNTVVLEKN